MNSSVLQKM